MCPPPRSDSIFRRDISCPFKPLTRFTTRRLRILWIVLGALLLVSVTPLWLYHRQVLQLSEEKLQDTERVQQSEITRSLASETLQFEQSLREQLLSQRQMLALTGWIENVDDPSHAPQLARLLQDFVENNSDILYVTAVNKEAKGPSAGSFSADQDPFVEAAWKRAFTSSMQGFDSLSEPFALGQDNRPGAGRVRAAARRTGNSRECWRGRVARPACRRACRTRACATARSTSSTCTGTSWPTRTRRELVPGRDVTVQLRRWRSRSRNCRRSLRATQTTNFLAAVKGRSPLRSK